MSAEQNLPLAASAAAQTAPALSEPQASGALAPEAAQMPAKREKKARSTSTDRSRAHRDRKRDAGGELLSFVLGPSATAALAILRAKTGRGKSKTVEVTLISDALRSVDSTKAARALAAKGLIDDATLKAWIAVLDASSTFAPADAGGEAQTPLGDRPNLSA